MQLSSMATSRGKARTLSRLTRHERSHCLMGLVASLDDSAHKAAFKFAINETFPRRQRKGHMFGNNWGQLFDIMGDQGRR